MRPDLRTPRAVLTSLISTLTTAPSTQSTSNQPASTNPAHPSTQAVSQPWEPPTNPLKSLPPSYRALLSTLHVLLPTGVLLQALDLLDRGLVLKVIEEAEGIEGGDGMVGRVVPPQAVVDLVGSSGQGTWGEQGQDQAQAAAGSDAIRNELTCHRDPVNEGASEFLNPQDPKRGGEDKRYQVYQVRSSQAPRSRFKDSSVSTSIVSDLTYTVRLEAWNCSCAAFAFEAFPAASYSSPWTETETDLAVSSDSDEEDVGGERKWEFGGLSEDGNEGGHVPVCKHLLACLLAERWNCVLGGYFKGSMVGKEEMAGLVGGG